MKDVHVTRLFWIILNAAQRLALAPADVCECATV
jgi:hypothetical protein